MSFSSAVVRFPLVFSSSIARMSIVCLASGRSFCDAPSSGCSSSPRCSSAELPSDSTKV